MAFHLQHAERKQADHRQRGGHDESGAAVAREREDRDPGREEDVGLLRVDGGCEQGGDEDRPARRRRRASDDGGRDEDEAHGQRVDAREVVPGTNQRERDGDAGNRGERQDYACSPLLRVTCDDEGNRRATGRERDGRDQASGPVVETEHPTERGDDDKVKWGIDLRLDTQRGIAVERLAGVKYAPGFLETVTLEPLDIHRVAKAGGEDAE